MSIVSIFVSDELKRKMSEFPSVNWSVVAREAIEQKIKDMEFLLEFKSNIKLTEEDALRLGAKVNSGLALRLENQSREKPNPKKRSSK